MKKYIELANHIDEVYHSGNVSHTENSAFVKIFKYLLDEDEVDIALEMNDTWKDANDLKGMNLDDIDQKLQSLSHKGILLSNEKNGEWVYRLLPYFPGIYEAMVNIVHDEVISYHLENYLEELKSEDNQIEINYEITEKPIIVAMDEINSYLDRSDIYSVCDCICRKIRKTTGKDCGHPIKDMCIQIGDYASFYIKTNRARQVSRKEVDEIFKKAKIAGLYHQIYPIDKSKNSAYICNCCSCGCNFMKLSGRIQRALCVTSNVSIDYERCIRCGNCIEQCPEGCFSFDGDVLKFDGTKCFNCGLCVAMCSNAAITLKE